MFYLKWIFLFNLFIFSSFSQATEDSGESKYATWKKPNSSTVLSDLDREILSVLLLDREDPDLYPGVVKLITEDQSGSGTGFFIRPGILTTAHHVADGEPLYFRAPSTMDKVSTEILGFDDEYDLVLLKAINYESEHFYSVDSLGEEIDDYLMRVKAELSERGPYERIEDTLTMVGFPQGFFRIIKGDMRRSRRRGPFISATFRVEGIIPDSKGISGGPVFSKGEELIGVRVGGIRVASSAGRKKHGSFEPVDIYKIRFVHVGYLRNLVKRVDNGEFLTTKE